MSDNTTTAPATELWVNMYRTSDGSDFALAHTNKEDALAARTEACRRTIRVVEVEEVQP